MEKKLKKLDNRNWKKRRSLVENYQRSLWPNQYIDGEEKGPKRREKKDGKKIRIDRKVSWDKES